jgi:hypothetical protein
MSSTETAVNHVLATSRRLAETDPQGEAIDRTVAELQSQVSLLNEQAREDKNSPWGAQSMKDDAAFIGDQIKKLKAASAIPAANYRRIYTILSSLEKAWAVASRPQNVAMRPKVASAIKTIAGIFAEVDTVQDLDKPLEQIEKAVHSLYGDQSDNHTYMIDARGKGHHTKE